jgi:DUF438 domain-containing protein
MISKSIMAAILDSLKGPVLFADTNHVTRYMNKSAIAHYTDGESQIGRSLLDCHNKASQTMMVEILAAMHEGLEEQRISGEEGPRIYMRAVRGPDGQVLGYYERHDPPPEPKT